MVSKKAELGYLIDSDIVIKTTIPSLGVEVKRFL